MGERGLGGTSTITSQILLVYGCRFMSGFLLLTRDGVGEWESQELVGSHSAEGVGGETSD